MSIKPSIGQGQYEIITTHPRIVLTKEAELSLQFLFLENEDANSIQNSLKLRADKFLENKSIDSDDINDMIQKDQLDKLFYEVTTIGMAYRLFEDNKYAEKVNEYLLAICELKDWSPENLEVTSQLTSIVGLGYDWLFYNLNREDRELIRNSIVQKGLNQGINALTNPSDTASFFIDNQDKMLLVSCGMALGSLSVADDFPDLNKRIIYRFLVNNQDDLQNLSFSILQDLYGDQWNKNAEYLAMTLASIGASLGHDFKITSLENVKNFSVDYLGYLGQVNNSEIDTEKQKFVLNPALLWFGKLNSNSEASDFYMESVKKYHLNASQKIPLNYMCLLWMI